MCRPAASLLPAFIFFFFPSLLSVSPSAFGKGRRSSGDFCDPVRSAEGSYDTIRHTIQSDTLLSRLWSVDRVGGCLGFFLCGFFELVKVLRAFFYKASRENEGSWSLPKRVVLRIWPSVLITVVGTKL